jgi:hypothetical protein
VGESLLAMLLFFGALNDNAGVFANLDRKFYGFNAFSG